MNHSIAGFFSNDVFSDRKNYGFVKLPNPRTGTDGVYLWNEGKKLLNEVQSFVRPHKSWIISDRVLADPALYVSTQIEPLFLVIPFLQQHAHHFTTVDTFTHTEEYPQFSIIMASIFECNDKLDALADSRKIDETMTVYKYNEQKTLNWLSGKVEKLSKHLKDKKIVADDSKLAVSINFRDCTETDEEYTARLDKETAITAVNIVSDYLTEECEALLKKHLHFEDIQSVNSATAQAPKHDRTQPLNVLEEIPNNRSAKKPAKAGPGRKSQAANESGLQSIKNFFK